MCCIAKREDVFWEQLLVGRPFLQIIEGSCHFHIGGLVTGFNNSFIELIEQSAFDGLGRGGLGGLSGWDCARFQKVGKLIKVRKVAETKYLSH